MANLTFPSNPTNGQKVTVNDKVFVYNSTTGRWTATRLQVLGNLTDDFTIDAPTLGVSLSTVALDTVGANVYITYTVDQDVKASLSTSGLENTTATLHQTNNTIVITAGATEFANGQINLVVSNGRSTDTEVINVSASYGWTVDLTQVTYDNVSFSVAQNDTSPLGLSFNNDGTKMFVSGTSTDSIYQYTLNTAFDLSTASYDNVSLNVSGQSINPSELTFNNDGTKMFVSDTATDAIYQYTLGTSFDLSTASYDNVSFDLSAQQGVPSGFTFNNDGTKMFWCDDLVHQYTLNTAFDLSTASYDNVSFSVGIDTSTGLAFNNDGTKLYVISITGDRVSSFTFGTAFDLSTISFDNIYFVVSGQEDIPTALAFNNDGTKLYVMGLSSDSIYQYSTGL
jgi:sugar lactone lactonase YvrE